jgi:drug/metabolite transporter (DMT)-like permease
VAAPRYLPAHPASSGVRPDEPRPLPTPEPHEDAVVATPELEGELPHGPAPPATPLARLALPPGMRYMAVGALAFSVMSLLVKVAGQRLPAQQIVLVRAVVTLALSAWAVRRAGVDPRGRRRGLLLLRGVLGFSALSAFYYAVVHLPLADATVLQYTNPVWAALLAIPFLGERVRLREAAAVAASLAGVLLVMRPGPLSGSGAPLPPAVVAIALGGAFCSAAAYVTVRKLGSTEHPSVIVLYFAAVSTAGALPTALPSALWPTGGEWLVLLGVGLTTQVGQVAITHGLRLERAGRATATGYLQIVFAALWGVLFFAERPHAGTVLGTGLIVAGTLALAGHGGPGAPRREGPPGRLSA